MASIFVIIKYAGVVLSYRLLLYNVKTLVETENMFNRIKLAIPNMVLS
jgi:hypothetical protein